MPALVAGIHVLRTVSFVAKDVKGRAFATPKE
jgi:hypothetical protein